MNVVLRADGGADIGAGHVMRCLALAQAAHDAGHRTAFLMAPGAEALEERLEKEGCTVHELRSVRGSREDALETVTLAQGISATYTVVDGYAFDAEYQHILKKHGIRLLVIDDYGHADAYHADMILNQNSYARKLAEIYRKRAPWSTLLLGSDYLLLRREYQTAHPKQETHDTVHNVLVTFGGGDSGEISLRIAKICTDPELRNLNVTMIIGAANPHADAIAAAAGSMNVIRDAQDMPTLLTQTDMAIAAGGTTSYELAYMGIPSLLFILADNQRIVAEDLHAKGIAHMIGEPDKVTDANIAAAICELMENTDRRKSMSAKGKRMIDGNGAARTVEAITAQ